MEHSRSWETNWFSTSHVIPYFYGTRRFINAFTSPYPEPDWSSQCSTSLFLKIHLSIIHPPMRGSSKWSPSLWSPHQTPVCISSLPHSAKFPAHHILNDLITQIIFGEKYRSLNSLNVSDQVPHLYKTTWKWIFSNVKVILTGKKRSER